MPRSPLIVFLASLVIACSSSNNDAPAGGGAGASAGGAGGSAGGFLPCDVDAVLAASCRSCHAQQPLFGAPMPLVSYTDLTAPAKSDGSAKVYSRVGARIHDDKSPMPQPPNPRLDAKAMATIDAWIAAGAPQGTGSCGAGGNGGAGGTGGSTSAPLCANPVAMKPASAWQMPTDASDVYVCYGFDLTGGSTDQIVAMGPRIDNSAIVHHILLLESDTAVSPTPTICDGGIGTKKMVYG